MICPSSIGRPAYEVRYWTLKSCSTRPEKGALASHASSSRALFDDIINGSIGHFLIVCAKRSQSCMFCKLKRRSHILKMSPRGNASWIFFFTDCSMLSHSSLSRRDFLCARTKLPDCTAVESILMTGGGKGSGGTTYGMFIAMRSYWVLKV